MWKCQRPSPERTQRTGVCTLRPHSVPWCPPVILALPGHHHHLAGSLPQPLLKHVDESILIGFQVVLVPLLSGRAGINVNIGKEEVQGRGRSLKQKEGKGREKNDHPGWLYPGLGSDFQESRFIMWWWWSFFLEKLSFPLLSFSSKGGW